MTIGETLAQSSNISTLFMSSFEKGEKMYQHLAYRNALELFLYAVERDPENYVARQRIADCYYRLGNIDEAEKRYAELAASEMADPVYKYQYAQVLSVQGKYGDAEKWFSLYNAAQKDDARGQEKLSFIYSLSYYFRDSVLYTISNKGFNSDQSDFAPNLHKNGIVFVSARDRDLFIKKKSLSAIHENESHLNVYIAPVDATLDEQVKPFYHDGMNTILHDGPITFFNNERNVAFTRNNTRNGKPITNSKGRVNLKLFFAKLNDDDQMSHFHEFQYNDDDYSVGHPFVSEDGLRLIFASDMPGGFGGVDLYESVRQNINDKWSKPVNLGANVNTLGDEFYPHLVGSTLYFSSNGHGGLGGLDIFSSSYSSGRFEFPINLGFPLNTSSDDFSLILDKSGRNGFFASNRPGGKGYDDIYQFTVNSFFLTVKTVERQDSAKRIDKATVSLFDENENLLAEEVTSANGIAHFDLDFDRDYIIKAKKKDYSFVDTLSYSTHTRHLGGDSVLVPLWKQSLFAKGSVYSNESQSLLDGATVTLENVTTGEKQRAIVDSTGRYDFKIQPNTRYRVTASKEGFLDSGFNLNTSNIFDGDLVNDFLLEEVFVEKAVIQFDFDKSQLRAEEAEQLRPILKELKRNKTATLNIGAHADSYGTNQYNKALSERRAEAVLSYFTANGIVRSRIEATGFGEELLLNRCSNGVECSEEEHSLNRRAEVKVQLPQ